VRHLSVERRKRGRDLTPTEHLQLVEEAVLEVRGATIFGEAVIAVVYLPVLALLGTEGKLFRPMATTVLFALAGAFVLSLTTIPVLASFVVRARASAHDTWLLRQAHRLYTPLLGGALRHRWLTVSVGVLALAGAALLFTTLGAELVPELDEGGALIEARRLPGVSLGESVATALRVERALLGAIPEVSDVVSRTGAPEVATDPMGLEQSDIYVGLKDRRAWRKGLTREALTREIAERVAEKVPEIAAGMSQPIQMRTNELLSGVRSDVAAVVYGRDLAELAAIGERVGAAIRGVDGAADVRVEPSTGLEYLRIHPDRAKLARYGLTVDDVNELTETMSVGHGVGVVLEGERRFDLVVKTRSGFQTSELDALGSLPLKSVNGQLVPLADVAKLEFTTGPVEVNRDKQSRRLVVEFNVRGRDLVSVVDDARAAVQRGAPLPAGYRIDWGGRFEHYLAARDRLALVVPLALALIVFLLWLAFRSMRPALLILLNVPFAIVGGVVALWIRGMPFSISAGVGFIALFGVAVLNGLVLVSFARRLEERGATHVAAIRQSAEQRLRPVLMTALVASLGFVPMALSGEPGSEVQRPLATVVIGGLLTATLLTLFVLPVVYAFLGGSVRAGAPSGANGANADRET
jgi:cobalt-zinc-cadmium resistance protein CzcA